MATPYLPTIRPLTAVYRSHGDYEDLLEWGSFRYHSLLQFNKANPQAEESIALTNLWAAIATDDENAIEDAAQRCFDIMFPFIQADYAWRSQSSNEVNLNEPIKLQVITRNGILEAVQHNRHIKYPINDPIDNVFPDLPIFTASEIEIVEEIVWNVSKIKLENSIYCLKSVHRGGGELALKRELSILPHCCHPNIIRFVGLIEPVDRNDKIEGMIIEYIPNAKSLQDLEVITPIECKRWTTQIQDAIEYLHKEGLVWGDAKAGNVLLREDSNVVLIDFGGGFTPGWVEQANSNTTQGDWQGFERIVEFMKTKAVL